MTDSLKQEAERRMHNALLDSHHCDRDKILHVRVSDAVAVAVEMVMQAEIVQYNAGVAAERERCAKIFDDRETSYRLHNNIRMALASRDCADAIRNESKPPDNPGKTHFYGDGCDEEHGKPQEEK